MTDIQNEDNRHQHAHKHTHTEQTKEIHSTKFGIFLFEILTFSALGVGSYFLKKYHNFTYVSSGMLLMTIYGKNCNKTVNSYKNKDFVIRRDRQNVTSESTPSAPLTS